MRSDEGFERLPGAYGRQRQIVDACIAADQWQRARSFARERDPPIPRLIEPLNQTYHRTLPRWFCQRQSPEHHTIVASRASQITSIKLLRPLTCDLRSERGHSF